MDENRLLNKRAKGRLSELWNAVLAPQDSNSDAEYGDRQDPQFRSSAKMDALMRPLVLAFLVIGALQLYTLSRPTIQSIQEGTGGSADRRNVAATEIVHTGTAELRAPATRP